MARDIRDILARTLIGEAANQGRTGQAAVAHTILNRARDPRWPEDPASVALQPMQFSAWNEGEGGNRLPYKYGPGDRPYQEALSVVDAVLAGDIEDPTGGAVYYYAPAGMPGGKEPNWWDDATAESGGFRTIGGHRFAGQAGGSPQAHDKYSQDWGVQRRQAGTSGDAAAAFTVPSGGADNEGQSAINALFGEDSDMAGGFAPAPMPIGGGQVINVGIERKPGLIEIMAREAMARRARNGWDAAGGIATAFMGGREARDRERHNSGVMADAMARQKAKEDRELAWRMDERNYSRGRDQQADEFKRQALDIDRQRMAGSGSAKPSAIEQKIALLEETGIPREIAVGIAAGRYTVTQNPETGEKAIVDKGTQEAIPLETIFGQPGPATAGTGGGQGAPVVDVQSGGAGEQPEQVTSLWDLADEAAGAVNAVRRGLAGTAGQLPGPAGEVFANREAVGADQAFRTSQNELIRTMTLNPRFPVAEVDRVMKMFPAPGAFNSASEIRERMRMLDRYLAEREAIDMGFLNDPTIPLGEKQQIRQALRAAQAFRARMGVPSEDRQSRPGQQAPIDRRGAEAAPSAPQVRTGQGAGEVSPERAADMLNKARAAIAAGKSRRAVIQTLERMGIDPGAL